MTPDQFIAKWKAVELKERSAAQSHFIDLCRMLDEPAPTDADPTGDWYAFERGATKTTGGEGWADVWKRGHFGWEYKGKRKDLNAAFVQLQRYALALENPPLLVVCDMDRFRIHTNWTNSVSELHEFSRDDLRDATVRQKLKWVLSDPERLKPGKTRQALTEDAAAEFAKLAQRLRGRGHPPETVAHFINRLVFCMFAEDVDLLPNSMFKRMLEHASTRPDDFQVLASDLFRVMKDGGRIGFERVAWFNGGLFNDDAALPLDKDDIVLTLQAAGLDWAEIDPSILGTLFERGLDPDKRSQLGAHYTDRDKVMLIIDPVIVRPWLAEWETTKAEMGRHMAAVTAARERRPTKQSEARRVHATARRAEEAAYKAAVAAYVGFLDRLRRFRVLDPACGSGNFLYLALTELKNIEHRANIEAELLGMTRQAPTVGPECVLGIEINPYAAELARVSVWIGEIQWMRRNGFGASRDPILKPLDTIECRDAIVDADGIESAWPDADVVIGNPPFLGASKFLRILGPRYSKQLREVYQGRVSGSADLVSYWFEKARAQIDTGKAHSVGLVATNTIRQSTHRPLLDRVAKTSPIFCAWSDLPWVNEGAAVRVSIICFGYSPNGPALDGTPVAHIHSSLTRSLPDRMDNQSGQRAKPLKENENMSFQGSQKIGSFDVSGDKAREWLVQPNPHGRPNSDVLKPLWNGIDVTRRPRDMWVIDFGTEMTEADAALYEKPFEHVVRHVKPERMTNNREQYRRYWWRHGEPRVALRRSLRPLHRYLAISEKSKHFYFIWLPTSILPDKRLIVIARDDDTTFGIVTSRFHMSWALRFGSTLEDRPCYTPSTCFVTYPFPVGLTPNIPGSRYASDPHALEIAGAAKKLYGLRDTWLNPSELTKRVPEVVPGFSDHILPVDEAAAAILKKRTLTNLYNERPAWLANAHRDLDAAVAAAYGWSADISENEALARLLEMNQSRAAVAL